MRLVDLVRFPHLKKCGPIEAFERQLSELVKERFPHLKKCGPIEAHHKLAHQIGDVLKHFPHLKKCGPIEAGPRSDRVVARSALSALEKVRPH